MKPISRISVGAFAGLLAPRIVPNSDPEQIVVAVVLGMAGAALGGLVVGVLGGPGTSGFDACSVFAATLGTALLLLCVYGHAARPTA